MVVPTPVGTLVDATAAVSGGWQVFAILFTAVGGFLVFPIGKMVFRTIVGNAKKLIRA